MTKKEILICLVFILLVASFFSYLKYIDTSNIDDIRGAMHKKVVTIEEFDNYIEEKELMGISYNPETNFISGILIDSAKTKYGIKPSDSGYITMGGVLEGIEEGTISNPAIIEKVEYAIDLYEGSYKNTFRIVLMMGLIFLVLGHMRVARNRAAMKKIWDNPYNPYTGMKPRQKDTEVYSNHRPCQTSVVDDDSEIVKDVKLSDIKGHDEIKDDITFVIKMLQNPEKYAKVGAKVPKGVLLFGPPGTGKTMIAKAMANEVGIPFFAAGGSDFVEKYVGVGAKRVRELFSEAKRHEKAIIYIDEIDAVGRKRGDNDNDERTSTLNALLMEMDGFGKSDNILVIASTNRVDILDDALLRPGRFDKHIAVNTPDLKGRLEILELYSKNKKLDKKVDMDYIAKITRGFSGAELANLLNEAAMLTAFRDKNKTSMLEIDDAYYKIVTKGDKKKDFDRSVNDTEITAWHEAGHAVVSWLLANQRVNKVTIIPSTSGAGGITLMEPKEGDYYSKKDLENMVKVCYGGRAAEYLLLEDEEKVTTGASNDIEKATNILMSMITNYGMNSKFGLINISKINGMNLESAVEEAKEQSNRIYEETKVFLKEHYSLLKELSEVLIEKETLDEKELEHIINRYLGYSENKDNQIIVTSFEEVSKKDKKSLKEKIFGEKEKEEKII